ncbi:type I-E CRISPR-associated protein Cas6/Cse3/CasE [Streptomyces sp. SKN60]|uniref:type I-E CRISPR-associated protein Cas6/Cse3/CasE n=1 Tax=Streptomyces sp. SKN60 TaxID=2855506 RepID=UPI002246D048|nr:type I-E CRISPR-associated protein Cas6/Cse3/CasE [Streptomyces sp. SKN60]MCX2182665.1 type I-E CRISPR-associated protein Cas6/Cse3/CasE [Streptomyces sp. SKN60]
MHQARLTLIRLNPAHPAVRRDLADYVGLHKTLMRLAVHEPGCPHPRRTAGLLFRLEPDRETPLLYVQTTHPPQLAGLPAGYGTARTTDLAPVLHHLTPGLHLRYRITANPSTRIGNNPPPRHPAPSPHPPAPVRRGSVIALHGPDALAWWQRRATHAGLTLNTTITMEPRPFRRPPGAAPGPHHRLVQFDGTAHVTDPAALGAALVRGIGRGQSYGAGLLSLAPA